jgi:phosphoribosylformylglycinamidine synthase
MPVSFFRQEHSNQVPSTVFLVQSHNPLTSEEQEKAAWLLNAQLLESEILSSPEVYYIGPRAEMETPWSTNAVEIFENTGIAGVFRIEGFEEYKGSAQEAQLDPMLQRSYSELSPGTLDIQAKPEPIQYIEDLESYNTQMGLALSEDEVEYLKKAEKEQGRPFTDSEIFGFAQVNSEHCRHKIFNGQYYINGEKKDKTLFKMIKETTAQNPNEVVTNYNDNVSFIKGERVQEFIPTKPDVPSPFTQRTIESVLSIKAETHNFPTTVEPFNGAATGAGGEIRDRMAGGKGSLPLAGTACYMTSYPRLEQSNPWNTNTQKRPWLYQTPQEILTKASNGASDYGNKFGQPLINGSLLTFEHVSKHQGVFYGFDKTIMMAGGVGYAQKKDALKDTPQKGDKIILLGGDNYRIGMGGGAVSSVDTGATDKTLELNAVQRSNPEMEKRAFNAVRALTELSENPIVLIHDHGAGGHINCLSELVEGPGGKIDITKLPVGDPSLSDKEIIGNESQERMGLVLKAEDVPLLERISERERAPMYVIGTITGDERFTFENAQGEKPVDVSLDFLFGKPPQTEIHADVLEAAFVEEEEITLPSSNKDWISSIENVLQLEGVGCKDWLTNKVDRSVTGRVAQQQCVGPHQFPLHGAGVMAIDFEATTGVATAMGHQPIAAILDPAKGSELSIAEALTNLVFVPLKEGLRSVTLSANWMWPCKAPGEDARLYAAVQRASEVAIELGINISTGKDSLSMTQKYPEHQEVRALGTVIISAVGATNNIAQIVTPDMKPEWDSVLVYVNLSGDMGVGENHLGGSALGQTQSKLGNQCPGLANIPQFVAGFNTIQKLVLEEKILAGQDISSGGLWVAALEMAFAGNTGLSLFGDFEASLLYSEKPSVLLQISQENLSDVLIALEKTGCPFFTVGTPVSEQKMFLDIASEEEEDTIVRNKRVEAEVLMADLLEKWMTPSSNLEPFQTNKTQAEERQQNLGKYPLTYTFSSTFKELKGKRDAVLGLNGAESTISRVKAAIIREKGTNGEREMAYSLHAAGFEVRDVTMTDLTSGRETLEDIQFAVFCGGFSNSDVLGSARGWAGVFRYHETAKKSLEQFYQRSDTMSLGVCNGCQLMTLLDLVHPEYETTAKAPAMEHNVSHKFESSFLNVKIPENTPAILFQGLEGSELGIWVAHGEGRFALEGQENEYNIAMKYADSQYPMNPNGSDYNAAGIVSKDGRHLAMMPHLERAIFPWQWGYCSEEQKEHEVTPWFQAFVNARVWLSKQSYQ